MHVCVHTVEQEISTNCSKMQFDEFYFHDVKIFICIFYISKSFASISGPFHVRIVLSLSSTLHSLENHVVAASPNLVHIWRNFCS